QHGCCFRFSISLIRMSAYDPKRTFLKMKILLIIFSILSTYGCCSLGSKNEFENTMNAQIGSRIEEHIYSEHISLIKGGNGRFGDRRYITRNEDGTVTYTRPMSSSDKCVVSTIIAEESWTITSWKYFDGNDDCRAGCDPW
ncbi:MAG: hypothetical protein AAF304_05540, partial [Pseudomonadota bacterium]